MTISVIVLCLDEEANLPGALASLHGLCDDIVVFDSGSTDGTVKIAKAAGARVFTREFDDYAAQRNAALDVDLRNDWVLMLDADERVTPALWAEMLSAIASGNATLFRMRRKDFFMGRWLRRSSGYPTWFGRLMKKGHVVVERDVNEEYVTDGPIGYLEEHLLHFPFNRGIDHWVDRHNRYSAAEARHRSIAREQPWDFSSLLGTDPVLRRKALKVIALKMPFRPTITFMYLYFWRLGILDGRAGYYFCRMRAFYELLIDLKASERESAVRATRPDDTHGSRPNQ